MDFMNLQALQEPRLLISALAIALLSYLVGSINFAVIFSRIFKHDDVRKYGSGNAGMTNMLRVYGKLPAACTAVFDFSKGILCGVLARLFFAKVLNVTPEVFDPVYFGLFPALLGHLYPIFFGFKGGKGVLTAFGSVLLLHPGIFAILFLIYVPMAFITKIVSLASILGMISYPILTFIQIAISGSHNFTDGIMAIVLVTLPIIAHHENIRRLLNGTERKFGKK